VIVAGVILEAGQSWMTRTRTMMMMLDVQDLEKKEGCEKGEE
jgi:hypothetical protein